MSLSARCLPTTAAMPVGSFCKLFNDPLRLPSPRFSPLAAGSMEPDVVDGP